MLCLRMNILICVKMHKIVILNIVFLPLILLILKKMNKQDRCIATYKMEKLMNKIYNQIKNI